MENENELKHYGVKGMHWGVRRYQNPDGTLTEEGRRRKQKTNDTGRNVKNYLKSKLGIYDPDDDNPYVSKDRKEHRRKEKQAAKDLKKMAVNAEVKIQEKNVKRAKKAAEDAQKNLEYWKGKQAVGSFFDKKYRNPDGSLNDEGKARKSKGKQYDADYWDAHDNKDPKYMSDKELQKRIIRLNNENQYKNLTENSAKKAVKKKTSKLANDVVDRAVLALITAAATRAAQKYGPKVIKKGKEYVKRQVNEHRNKKWLY